MCNNMQKESLIFSFTLLLSREVLYELLIHYDVLQGMITFSVILLFILQHPNYLSKRFKCYLIFHTITLLKYQ